MRFYSDDENSEQVPSLTDRQKQFLDNPYVGVATTLRRGWLVADDGRLGRPSTARRIGVVQHRLRPPQADQSRALPAPPAARPRRYRWVAIEGASELTAEAADTRIDRLAKKDLDQDEYPCRNPEEKRDTVRIHPSRIDAYGLE